MEWIASSKNTDHQTIRDQEGRREDKPQFEKLPYTENWSRNTFRVEILFCRVAATKVLRWSGFFSFSAGGAFLQSPLRGHVLDGRRN